MRKILARWIPIEKPAAPTAALLPRRLVSLSWEVKNLGPTTVTWRIPKKIRKRRGSTHVFFRPCSPAIHLHDSGLELDIQRVPTLWLKGHLSTPCRFSFWTSKTLPRGFAGLCLPPPFGHPDPSIQGTSARASSSRSWARRGLRTSGPFVRGGGEPNKRQHLGSLDFWSFRVG